MHAFNENSKLKILCCIYKANLKMSAIAELKSKVTALEALIYRIDTAGNEGHNALGDQVQEVNNYIIDVDEKVDAAFANIRATIENFAEEFEAITRKQAKTDKDIVKIFKILQDNELGNDSTDAEPPKELTTIERTLSKRETKPLTGTERRNRNSTLFSGGPMFSNIFRNLATARFDVSDGEATCSAPQEEMVAASPSLHPKADADAPAGAPADENDKGSAVKKAT